MSPSPTPQHPRITMEIAAQIKWFLKDHPVGVVLPEIDVVNILRIQLERQGRSMFPSIREYAHLFGINQERLGRAKPDLLVLHPGPMNRGVEITPEVADGNQSVILRQVTNGLAVRMAVLYLVSGGQPR